jgi:hypothetical protein
MDAKRLRVEARTTAAAHEENISLRGASNRALRQRNCDGLVFEISETFMRMKACNEQTVPNGVSQRNRSHLICRRLSSGLPKFWE